MAVLLWVVLAGPIAPVAAQETPVAGPLAGGTPAKENALIRTRIRDYEAQLEADHAVGLRHWRENFGARRRPAIAATITRVLNAGARLRAARGLDAGGLKTSPEFRAVLANELKEQLQPQELRTELGDWARTVENATRSRMIECFQQIIAEDLGRVFDEHLSNQVVKAVRAIPLETILAKEKPGLRIEEAILAGLPNDALSSGERKAVSTAAGFLAGTAATVLTTDKFGLKVASVIGNVAGLGVEKTADFFLRRLNDTLTAKPDPEQLAVDYEQALLEWNVGTLQPRLEGILAEFRRAVLAQVESHARQVNRVILP